MSIDTSSGKLKQKNKKKRKKFDWERSKKDATTLVTGL